MRDRASRRTTCLASTPASCGRPPATWSWTRARIGTFVNGEPVAAQRVLRAGDVIEIGPRVFEFELPAEPAELAADEAMTAASAARPTRAHRRSRATGKSGLLRQLPANRNRWRGVDSPLRRGRSGRHGDRDRRLLGGVRAHRQPGGLGLRGRAQRIGRLLRCAAAARHGAGRLRRGRPARAIRPARDGEHLAQPVHRVRADRGARQRDHPPVLHGLGSQMLGPKVGIVAGKLVADLLFYAPPILTTEARRRRHERRRRLSEGYLPVPDRASIPECSASRTPAEHLTMPSLDTLIPDSRPRIAPPGSRPCSTTRASCRRCPSGTRRRRPAASTGCTSARRRSISGSRWTAARSTSTPTCRPSRPRCAGSSRCSPRTSTASRRPTWRGCRTTSSTSSA